MIDASFTPGRKLEVAAFNALKRILASANSFELTYSNLDRATAAIRSVP